MTPERYRQNSGGTSMRRVDAFRRTVNATIESARDPVTIYGYHFHFSPTDPASMTGSTGRTQGARIVRTQAMKEMSASESIGESIRYMMSI